MPIVSKAIILHEMIRISESAKCLKRNDKKNTAIPNVKSMLINMVKNLNCLSLIIHLIIHCKDYVPSMVSSKFYR